MSAKNRSRQGSKFSRATILRVVYASLTFIVLFSAITFLMTLVDRPGLFFSFLEGILLIPLIAVVFFCYGWAKGHIYFSLKHPNCDKDTED